MALKSVQLEPDKVDVEALLDLLNKTLDRVKSLYEQYFLGLQKQPPTFIHNDLERKLRDLQGLQIRNTGLRYRMATLQQKYGSYNTYWRRTLRQIENGTYARSLQKLGRKAARSGEEIPEEILAKMPKRMREQVQRDREAVLARERRRRGGDFYDEYSEADLDVAGAAVAATMPRNARGAHLLSEDDDDLDLEALFASVESDADPTYTSQTPAPPSAEPEFDDVITPPAPAPVPSGPAPLRAAALGPRAPRAVSPVVLAAKTDPGLTNTRRTGSMPVVPTRRTGPMPAVQPNRQTGPIPTHRASTEPGVSAPPSSARPSNATIPSPAPFAPSQGARPNPIAPGSSIHRSVGVESMEGPFPRARAKRDTDLDHGAASEPPSRVPTPPPMPRMPTAPGMRSSQRTMRPTPTPTPTPTRPSQRIVRTPTPTPTPQRPMSRTPTPRPSRPQRPPPGMSDADVQNLYSKYVQAKAAVGEATGPHTYGKLLNTINSQAPKIMQQYKARGVDFSVVVKDNQVIIRAKPKP